MIRKLKNHFVIIIDCENKHCGNCSKRDENLCKIFPGPKKGIVSMYILKNDSGKYLRNQSCILAEKKYLKQKIKTNTIEIFANIPNCTKIGEVQNFQLSKKEIKKIDRENLIIDNMDDHCHVNGQHYLLHQNPDYPEFYPDGE